MSSAHNSRRSSVPVRATTTSTWSSARLRAKASQRRRICTAKICARSGTSSCFETIFLSEIKKHYLLYPMINTEGEFQNVRTDPANSQKWVHLMSYENSYIVSCYAHHNVLSGHIIEIFWKFLERKKWDPYASRQSSQVWRGIWRWERKKVPSDCRESSLANETAHRREIFWKFLERKQFCSSSSSCTET
jgi:hypothetical protein